MITKDTYIENLIEDLPESIEYFLGLGISLLVCGEPAWGTIEELCLGRGLDSAKIDEIVEQLNSITKD